tara:strand:+ start:138 stop:257 length:120 start_codon:yes stop_codon:yes gene_type:complete
MNEKTFQTKNAALISLNIILVQKKVYFLFMGGQQDGKSG